MRIAYIKFLAAVLLVATSLVCLGQEPTSKNPRGLYKMTRLTGREDNAEKQRQTQQKKSLAMIPDAHLSVGTGSDTGILKVDTLQDYVTEGLHVVHLKMDFFGDEYRYSLTEQEENLRSGYDEKGNWSMLTEEGRTMWTEDMLKLHALVRQKFFQMRQKKILKWEYHLAMKCKSDTQGNIIHVCLTSHRPILKRVGIKKMKQLLHWVGTNKLRCGNTRKERLYHEGSISLFMRGSDEKVSHK